MKKLSTTQDLIFHDMNQSRAIFNRYWRSSSLPPRERDKNRPKTFSRRDKVFSKIIRLEMMASMKRIQGYSEDLKLLIDNCESENTENDFNPHTA
ncbi:hypothetical protein AI29_10005 [bacteria symbiont BFo2 of Frankliniella occidentalis]|nr:hypothetical protein AI29_10005 [bacteria symbiont BFo2 of Frankliniella occidentalis]